MASVFSLMSMGMAVSQGASSMQVMSEIGQFPRLGLVGDSLTGVLVPSVGTHFSPVG